MKEGKQKKPDGIYRSSITVVPLEGDIILHTLHK
jgi:hypothetical protein